MAPPDDLQMSILEHGELSTQGKFLWGSNYTFLVEVTLKGETVPAVYKPIRGERPLWDFPTATLAGREVAAYLVSKALGWYLVPPTVFRRQAPQGPGSLQLFIEHEPEYHYFNFSESDRQRLRPVVLFDLLINNADRKGSHVLIDPQNRLWLIDHGICFHTEHKLRTVIWDFAGEPLPPELCADLERFQTRLQRREGIIQTLEEYVSPRELAALADRADRLLASGHFPNPRPNVRPYPWPPV